MNSKYKKAKRKHALLKRVMKGFDVRYKQD
jgi:hypothetical protein